MQQVLLLLSLNIKSAEKHHKDAHVHITRFVVLCSICLNFQMHRLVNVKDRKKIILLIANLVAYTVLLEVVCVNNFPLPM